MVLYTSEGRRVEESYDLAQLSTQTLYVTARVRCAGVSCSEVMWCGTGYLVLRCVVSCVLGFTVVVPVVTVVV